MLEFLKDANISDGTIKEMYSILDDYTIYNLYENSENCLGIILLFQKLKIRIVESLLIYRPEWFLNTFEYVSSCFKNDLNLVEKINDNFYDVSI